MKLSFTIVLATLSSVVAFAPASQQGRTPVAMNAQQGDRKAFLSAAAASIAAAVPLVANAGTMGQERVNDPTEVYVFVFEYYVLFLVHFPVLFFHEFQTTLYVPLLMESSLS